MRHVLLGFLVYFPCNRPGCPGSPFVGDPFPGPGVLNANQIVQRIDSDFIFRIAYKWSFIRVNARGLGARTARGQHRMIGDGHEKVSSCHVDDAPQHTNYGKRAVHSGS